MIAIVDIGGHQALISKGDVIAIDKIEVEVGKSTTFPVLLVSESDGTNFQIGTPLLDGVTVKAKVLEHYKDDKVTVFKMKPRKRYRRTYGHRSRKTKVEIVEIGGGGAKSSAKSEEGSTKKAVGAKEAPKKTDAKAPAKKAAPAKKPAAKKAAPKKDS